MDSGTSCPASLSDATLLRESSEVGAVCVNAHVRICAGGGLRRPSLPRRRTELVWKLDTGLGCKALRLIATQAHPIGNVQLGKLAVVRRPTKNIYGSRLRGRSAPVFGLRMHQGGFQNLDGVLAPVQGSDRVHIEIHT